MSEKQELPPFSETYKGFLIQYREHDNNWTIQRSASTTHIFPSLIKAREHIDRLEKQEKKTFRRHSAILVTGYGDDKIVPVEVTSYVVKDGYRDRDCLHAWVKYADGTRSCETVDKLRESTPGNAEKAGQITLMAEEIAKLYERQRDVRRTLTGYRTRNAQEAFGGDAPIELLPYINK